MIKQVPVSELRAGMHLHKLGGSWTDHPFWRRSFLLKVSDLQPLLETGIETAWIDTGRGLDVETAAVPPADGPEEAVQQHLAEPKVDYIDMPPLPAPTLPMSLDEPEVRETDLARANAICTDAGKVLRRLHEEVRMGRAFDSLQCAEVVGEIVDHMMDNPSAMLLTMRLKNHDEYAYMHSIATAALMVAMARQMGFGRVQMCELGVAGMMHDIGKLFVPTAILQKPAPLTTQEYLLVKTHVQRGYAALLQSRSPSTMVLDVCLHHHERVDGTGYPHGLGGDEISLAARMAAICDVYDATTSDRPHRGRLDPSRALRQMASAQGQFDPTLFQSFVKTVGIYPVGIVVRLQSERLAVVVSQDERSLLKPTVKVFYSVDKQQPLSPSVVHLASDLCDDRIVDVDCTPEMQMRALAEL
jgi:HD-GYP domain-containing protein (c-di-GMP phosphodiesterase class II)